ncbi:MAG TPA: PA14 domain-containing protein, partial [Abditibacteriaceae bacterium]
GGDFEIGPFNALETDMEGLGLEQDISGEYDPALLANSNFTDTGFTPAQGTAPNPPEHNPESKAGLAGALVLPPMPPLGTEKGRNPQLRAPKPNTRAALAPPTPRPVPPQATGRVAQRPAPRKTEPRRIAKMPPPVRQMPSGESAPPGLSVGSYSQQGTIPMMAPRTRLPLGTPVPDISVARTQSRDGRPVVNSSSAASGQRQMRPGANQKMAGNGRDKVRMQSGKASPGRPMAGKSSGKNAPLRKAKGSGKAQGKGAQSLLIQGAPGQSGQPTSGQLRGPKQGQGAKTASGAPQRAMDKATSDRMAQLEKSTAKATQNSQLLTMLARKVLAQQLVNQKVPGNAAKTRRYKNSQGVKDGSKSPLPPTPLPDSDAEIGDGSGLKGEYYLGRNFDQYVFTRADPNIEFFWGADASPSPRLPVGADWTVRWTGKIEPRYSENYTFYAAADDGVRLWIDHKLIIDNWTLHPMLEYSGQIKLQAGKQYSIRVEFFEGAGPPAAVWLYWESASQKKEFVPQEQLFYPLAGDDAELDKDELPGNS